MAKSELGVLKPSVVSKRPQTSRMKRLVTVVLGIGGILAFSSFSLGALWTQYVYQEPFWVTWSRLAKPEFDWQAAKYPSLRFLTNMAKSFFAEDPRFASSHEEVPPPLQVSDVQFGVVGPKLNFQNRPVHYTQAGQALPMTEADEKKPSGAFFESWPNAHPITVSSAEELRIVLRKPLPGQHILLLPGVYELRGSSIRLHNGGTAQAPIFLRANRLGDVVIRNATREGFVVLSPYWVFENLVIEGTCQKDDECEHALHVVGNANSTIIRNSFFKNMATPIKINMEIRSHTSPNNGIIEGNFFGSDRPLKTNTPLTYIDGVAVNGWLVRNNVIADFAKNYGSNISYAGFFKGAGKNNIFERNLVMCEWRHHGGVRVGLSFGGGGSRPKNVCADNECVVEHENGIIRNNIIANCPNDVGIYLNKSSGTIINNNLLINTRGIDVRFPESSADIRNNIIDGRIASRNGGAFVSEGNVLSGWQAAFLSRISRDFFIVPKQIDFRSRKNAKLPAGVAMANSGRDICGQVHNPFSPGVGPFVESQNIPCIKKPEK